MSKKIVLIVALMAFAVSLPMMAAAKTYTWDLDETYSIAKDGTLFLNTEDAEVTLIAEDRSDVHIVIHHQWHVSGVSSSGWDQFEVLVMEENGNLRIREAESDGMTIVMGSVYEDYTVEIKAPPSINLRIRGEDDDYRIRGFSGEVRLDFEDGRAQLADMTGAHFEIGFEDGDLEMDGGSGMLDIYGEDGTAMIENGDFSEVNGRVEDGDISVSTKIASNGNYRLRAEDGDLELFVLDGGGQFRLMFEDGSTRVGRSFDEVDDEEGYEEYSLPGGNATVRLQVEDGRISLRTK